MNLLYLPDGGDHRRPSGQPFACQVYGLGGCRERRRADVADAGRVEVPAAPVHEPRDQGAEAAVLSHGVRHPVRNDDRRVPEMTAQARQVAERVLRVRASDESEHGTKLR